MWLRKRIDIEWTDLLWGAIWCGWPGRSIDLAAAWPDAEHALACTSVRSGFDLLLSAWQLPQGSHVLLSALTIPDMARIVRHHGLKPVPVDLDSETLSPRLEAVRLAMSPQVRAIVIAHLFGSRTPLAPLIDWARRHDVKVIEDCAQAYDGPNYSGHPDADVSMFSFGQIKASTALGGGILFVRERELRDRMQQISAAYPVQSRHSYLRRILKCATLKAVSSRFIFRAMLECLRAGGINYDRTINGLARGYSGSNMMRHIRKRPSAPLLRMMSRRLSRYDEARAVQRKERGRQMTRWLAPDIGCPTTRTEPHTFWVFPILVENPPLVISALREEGFDATQGQSMEVVFSSEQDHDCEPAFARDLLTHIVYVPFYSAIPDRELLRMAVVIKRVAKLPIQITPAARTPTGVGRT
jgi:perosamine synthetase